MANDRSIESTNSRGVDTSLIISTSSSDGRGRVRVASSDRTCLAAVAQNRANITTCRPGAYSTRPNSAAMVSRVVRAVLPASVHCTGGATICSRLSISKRDKGQGKKGVSEAHLEARSTVYSATGTAGNKFAGVS